MILCPANSWNIYIYICVYTFILSYAIRFSFVLYLAFFFFSRVSFLLSPPPTPPTQRSIFCCFLSYVSLCTQKHIHKESEREIKKQTSTVASWFIQPNAQIFGLTVCGCCECSCMCVCVYEFVSIYCVHCIHFTRTSMRECVNVFIFFLSICLYLCVCVYVYFHPRAHIHFRIASLYICHRIVSDLCACACAP